MGLLDRFRPLLTIGAERGALVFRRGDAEVRQQPVIRVAPDGRIIDFGDAGTHGDESRIQLFSDRTARANLALRAFCRYDVMRLSPRAVGLRPRVMLLESQLRQAFGAEAVTKLWTVLVQARFIVNRPGGV